MNKTKNTWLPGWLPGALDKHSVCVEYFGRGAEALPGMADRFRVWSGWYWHVERKRGAHRYVAGGEVYGPFKSRSSAMDDARLKLQIEQRDNIRRVA